MTTAGATRSITVTPLTRVEGLGNLTIRIAGESLDEVRLDIGEPPRFFEAFIRGRHLTEVADLVGRICGICPVAHQTSAVEAIEAATGITLPPELERLRRLLYCAEWIESHALHIYLLNLPDFLGYESAIALAATAPEAVARGLRLKRAGGALVEAIGGRETNPIALVPGGFWKTPSRETLLGQRAEIEWALGAAIETAELVSTLDVPQFESDYEFVALHSDAEYAIQRGTIATSSGESFAPEEYEANFMEEHVERSTALHSLRTATGKSYLVGPLSRMALSFEQLTFLARKAAVASGIRWPSRNPFASIVARAVEMILACEDALAIIDAWTPPAAPRVPIPAVAGRGSGATEAPRGLVYHRYSVARDGLIDEARIIPPTAQNLRRIEDDLRLLLAPRVASTDAELTHLAESLVRSYDPCISCSTHAIRVRIERSGA